MQTYIDNIKYIQIISNPVNYHKKTGRIYSKTIIRHNIQVNISILIII